MPPVSSSTIRTTVSALFVLLLVSPFFLDRWLTRDTDERGTDSANPGQYGFYLTDATAEAGIDFVHARPELDPKLEPIMPHVSALGASVSVVDFDNDGWQDLYATSSRKGTPNAMYRNLGDGSFVEVAGEAGLAEVNGDGGVSMGSVWGDYDNDGFEDVYIYMWGRQRLYRNLGDGTFKDVTGESGLDRWMNANSAVWTDVNRDGLIDLYVGGYFSEVHDLWQVTTTRIMQESFEYANNGGHNHLFLNRGEGRFEDVTEAYGADCTRWTMSVGAADLNGDGWPDLYLANDYGPEVLFVNIEGKRFEQLAGATLEETSKSGMNVAFGDLYNDGRADVYVTNISKRGYLFQGNNLRRNLIAENGRMINIAEGEIADAGWAWGAQFGDLNNDGFVDLFVTNGFVSADPEEDYWYEMSRVAMGNNNIFQDAKNWAPMGDQSLSGFERSRLYLNDGTRRVLRRGGIRRRRRPVRRQGRRPGRPVQPGCAGRGGGQPERAPAPVPERGRAGERVDFLRTAGRAQQRQRHRRGGPGILGRSATAPGRDGRGRIRRPEPAETALRTGRRHGGRTRRNPLAERDGADAGAS